MDKLETDAKHVLNKLNELSSFLAAPGGELDIDQAFDKPLEIMQKTMSFDVSVLYKITNAVEDSLLLRVVRLSDPGGFRPDLYEGKRFQLCLSSPDYKFINEAIAFETRSVSSINVPGQGCDIMGFIFLPDSFGGGYLFGGDFSGEEAQVKDYEASVCGIMCNYLSTILIKGQLEKLAVNDNLTGLFNSRKIKEEVERVCRRFKRRAGSFASLALCDIDHFKAVNDTWGHLQGDMILREVGGILKSSMRENFDVAGRYGGEEFLMIFDETDGTTALEIVERIRKKIQAHQFTKIDGSGAPVTGKHLSITLSFGIAENSLTEEGAAALSRDEWISRADQALYRAKEQGRNRTIISEI
ncbi:MAG: GGDEF domain-containing protein [Desulfobacter sp.]|nr:MAG: GGDEF domain-containing protein [Desulfobacter sp.]